MARKDIRHRETKKIKKGVKQTAPALTIPLNAPPEVVRKKRPARAQDQP